MSVWLWQEPVNKLCVRSTIRCYEIDSTLSINRPPTDFATSKSFCASQRLPAHRGHISHDKFSFYYIYNVSDREHSELKFHIRGVFICRSEYLQHNITNQQMSKTKIPKYTFSRRWIACTQHMLNLQRWSLTYFQLYHTIDMIDWLEFNGTFSTIRLYLAFRSYSLVYVFENGSILFSSGWPAT